MTRSHRTTLHRRLREAGPAGLTFPAILNHELPANPPRAREKLAAARLAVLDRGFADGELALRPINVMLEVSFGGAVILEEFADAPAPAVEYPPGDPGPDDIAPDVPFDFAPSPDRADLADHADVMFRELMRRVQAAGEDGLAIDEALQFADLACERGDRLRRVAACVRAIQDALFDGDLVVQLAGALDEFDVVLLPGIPPRPDSLEAEHP